jgi:hypothetical protein
MSSEYVYTSLEYMDLRIGNLAYYFIRFYCPANAAGISRFVFIIRQLQLMIMNTFITLYTIVGVHNIHIAQH